MNVLKHVFLFNLQAYLKFCCKVQGIRNELFAADTCRVVALDEIKQHFPQGTTFEDYWPAKGSIEPVHAQRVPAGNWTQKPATANNSASSTPALPAAKPTVLPQALAQSYNPLAAAASSRSNAAHAAAMSPYDVSTFQQLLRFVFHFKSP